MTHFPPPLRLGDHIAITAPSSGVSGRALARLDLVLNHLRTHGYQIVEGECLRNEFKDASAPREKRTHELVRFLEDPTISAVFPPWGGARASELLDLIDFKALRLIRPKWFLGFSDLSTLHLPLTLVSGWATAHGPNLMDLVPTQTDPLTTAALFILASGFHAPVVQHSSLKFQKEWIDYAVRVDAPLNLTESTEWKRLDGLTEHIEFHGHLIGGCIDAIAWLAGTKFGDVPSFIERMGKHGTILYLENNRMEPTDHLRALLSLRRHRWFDGLSGLLVGRSAGPIPDSPSSLSYPEALLAVLGDLPYPVLYDVDIGHLPPQFTLINGAHGHVQYDSGSGTIAQMARD